MRGAVSNDRPYRDNGLGGFGPTAITTTVGLSVGTLAVGDFNGDGKLDLVMASANFGGSMSILLGSGSGGFSVAPGSPFATATFPYAVAVGDFNGDGKPDLAVAEGLGRVAEVLLGDGTGRVVSFSVLPLPSIPSDIKAADFNKDGKLDLAVAAGRGGVMIFLGDGSGGFSLSPGSPVAAGSLPNSVTVADFNGDGKLDIAFAEKTSGLTVFLGDGSGGFSAATGSPFALGTFPYTVTVGDFNSDGKPDLVITSGITSSVTALLNMYPFTAYVCTNTTPPAITSIDSASAYGGYPYFASGS